MKQARDLNDERMRWRTAEQSPGVEFELEGRIARLGARGIEPPRLDMHHLDFVARQLSALQGKSVTRAEERKLTDQFYGGELRVRASRLKIGGQEPHSAHDDKSTLEDKGWKEEVPEIIEKRRLAWVDCRGLPGEHDVRLSLKRERHVAESTVSGPLGRVMRTRTQTRRSFWTLDGCRIDLSIVRGVRAAEPRSPPPQKRLRTAESESEPNDTTSYEIEVEQLDYAAGDALVQWLLRILSWCNAVDGARPCDATETHLRFLVVPSPPSSETLEAKPIRQTGRLMETMLVAITREIIRA